MLISRSDLKKGNRAFNRDGRSRPIAKIEVALDGVPDQAERREHIREYNLIRSVRGLAYHGSLVTGREHCRVKTLCDEPKEVDEVEDDRLQGYSALKNTEKPDERS